MGQEIQIWHYFFILTSWRSVFDLWPLIRGQSLNFTFVAWCISKYRFFESRNSNMALLFHFDHLEVSFDLWPLIRGLSLNFTFVAWCISKYRFFGSRNSNMALLFHLTSGLWLEVKVWILLLKHDVYLNVGFFGQEIQIWHYFFILTPWRSFLTSDLWSEVKTSISLL